MSPFDYAQALFTLVAILAGLALLARAINKHNLLAKLGLAAPAGRRLTIITALAIDAKTRIIVVRDGADEHLILSGPAQLVATRPAAKDPE